MWTDYVYVSMLAHFNLHCKHGLWAGVRLIICRLVLRRVELTTSLTTNWNVKKLDNKIMFTNKQKNHTWSIIYWRYNNLQFPHLPTLTQQWPDRTQEVSIPSSSDHLFTKGRRLLVKLEMWANAQCDGRPAEYRWRPLFNAAKFGWRPLLDAVQ